MHHIHIFTSLQTSGFLENKLQLLKYEHKKSCTIIIFFSKMKLKVYYSSNLTIHIHSVRETPVQRSHHRTPGWQFTPFKVFICCFHFCTNEQSDTGVPSPPWINSMLTSVAKSTGRQAGMQVAWPMRGRADLEPADFKGRNRGRDVGQVLFSQSPR